MALEHQSQACALLGQGLARGWTLDRALRLAVAGCDDARLRGALQRAAALAEEGKSLEEALSDAGLPPAVREAAACLDQRDAGDLLDKLASVGFGVRLMRRRLVAALTYPFFLVAATVGTGLYVVHRVLPLVEEWHRETSGRIPSEIRLTSGLETLLGPMGGLALLLVLVGLLLAWKYGGWRWRSRLMGPLVCRQRAGIVQALATLLRSGQPLPDSLSRVARACGDRVAEQALLSARARVEQGTGVTDALVTVGLVPPAWAGPLHTAEGDGEQLPRALAGIGEVLGLEAELGARALPSVMLPLATVLAGGLVGWIAIALFGGLRWYS